MSSCEKLVINKSLKLSMDLWGIPLFLLSCSSDSPFKENTEVVVRFGWFVNNFVKVEFIRENKSKVLVESMDP